MTYVIVALMQVRLIHSRLSPKNYVMLRREFKIPFLPFIGLSIEDGGVSIQITRSTQLNWSSKEPEHFYISVPGPDDLYAYTPSGEFAEKILKDYKGLGWEVISEGSQT
jgi:hypothetical protein